MEKLVVRLGSLLLLGIGSPAANSDRTAARIRREPSPSVSSRMPGHNLSNAARDAASSGRAVNRAFLGRSGRTTPFVLDKYLLPYPVAWAFDPTNADLWERLAERNGILALTASVISTYVE
jgi:hypothetical protein